MSGLYLHIPFCKQACSYCDFYFVTRQDQKAEFVEKLIHEIHSKRDTVYSESVIETVYFGGGTPSLLTIKELTSIFEAIQSTFHLEPEEITIELNPDDVTKKYLEELQGLGINRVSMGVQSFNEELLRFMHRAHNSEEALKCLEILQASGIDVYTVDLIYGNPSQTLEMLEEDIDRVIQFDPPHISAYSLTIEPRTRLGKQLELGRLVEPEDEIVEQHISLVESKLKEAGLLRYEVSNFSKPGKKAVHNTNYWEHKNYLGLGPGAHSFWWDEHGRSATRWSNEANLKKYLTGSLLQEKEILALSELAEERIMLALRTSKGFTQQELKSKYNYKLSKDQLSYLERMVFEKKISFKDDIKLTSEGLKIADTITLDLLTA